MLIHFSFWVGGTRGQSPGANWESVYFSHGTRIFLHPLKYDALSQGHLRNMLKMIYLVFMKYYCIL